MLKADLHIHTGEDPKDKWINYSAKELIDKATDLGFEVLSLTQHKKIFFDNEITEYAKSKGILLIPGVELTLEGNHVLLYNFKQSDINKIRTISDIKKYKHKNNLVLAPHPYFLQSICLGNKIEKYKEIFDGVEFSHFYTKLINFNKKAVLFAKRNKKAVIANSDLHFLKEFKGNNYTLINSDKNVHKIIHAIKKNKIKIETKPLNIFEFIKYLLKLLSNNLFIKLRGYQ